MQIIQRVMLLLASSLLCGCITSSPMSGDAWLGKDKAYHFTASALASAGVAAIAKDQDLSDGEALAWAFAVTVPLGVGKEVYDQEIKGTGWSWKDLVWDVAGAAVGALVVVESD